jgi:lipoprotein signal peptidase
MVILQAVVAVAFMFRAQTAQVAQVAQVAVELVAVGALANLCI